MESQGQSVLAEGAYLRVLLGHTGQQLVVPFEPTTAVSTAVDIILQKQPLAHPQVLLTCYPAPTASLHVTRSDCNR